MLLFKESKSLSPFMVMLQRGATYNHQLFVSVSCFLFDSLLFPNLISLLGFYLFIVPSVSFNLCSLMSPHQDLLSLSVLFEVFHCGFLLSIYFAEQ